jgi:predicted transcriptional regulator
MLVLIRLSDLNSSNHLIQFSELEFASNVELSLPFFTLMIIVGMMSTKNIIKTKNSCRQIILDTVLSKPITFMKLVSESQCASETVEKYVRLLLDDCDIHERKGKFRILHSPKLNLQDVEFYELMLNPTVKSVTLVLLNSNPLSQIELVAITDKSSPSISRALKLLLSKRIISRNYHAPYSTYQIIDKAELREFLKTTLPSISDNIDKFDICYPKPSIFLEVHD